MKLAFADRAWRDYVFWQQNDKRMSKRINKLITDIMRSPFLGLGKPEPLRYGLHGYYSRRIDEEHRFVYMVEDDEVTIILARFHYDQR